MSLRIPQATSASTKRLRKPAEHLWLEAAIASSSIGLGRIGSHGFGSASRARGQGRVHEAGAAWMQVDGGTPGDLANSQVIDGPSVKVG